MGAYKRLPSCNLGIGGLSQESTLKLRSVRPFAMSIAYSEGKTIPEKGGDSVHICPEEEMHMCVL